MMESESDLKPRVYKQSYEPKANRADGLILQVHHTSPGPTGDIRRARFNFASFSSCNELLAVADHRGNIFVVDLSNYVFWLLGNQASISVLSFHSHWKDRLLVGTTAHCILLLNAETGQQLGSLSGHTQAPTKVSFSTDGNFCLSITSQEGFIWDLRSLSQAHRLNLQQDMAIKQAFFMPVSDNILACFQDDAIHVWAFPTFQCVRQIVPDTWQGHNIQSITFTRNGRAMVIGGTSRQLVILTVDNWDAQHIVQLPEFVSGVRHVEFLPQAFDSGANKVLAILTESGSLIFTDLTNDNVMKSRGQKNLSHFTCSSSGKYVACGMVSGEVKIFSGSQFLANATNTEDISSIVAEDDPVYAEAKALPRAPKPKINVIKDKRSTKKTVSKVSEQIGALLDLNRLRPILKEFLEYPDQYRSLIWRSILELPGNKEPWNSLSQRPLHPSAEVLCNTYPIQNKIMFKCLQSVISCLAHWSPVFGEVSYLPHFIFPFIKVFHSDDFVCFEVAATIIVNWCQHWFEYLSFPPVNILGMIENVLAEHDTALLSLFCDAGVTSRLYAWSLLSTAFSEVLSSAQWKQLWDHIISNPPWFLLFAVVAYSISCRASLKSCKSKHDFEFFFCNQNPINMKYFIKKCYDLMEKTSKGNHPSQYLKPFTSLGKGNYPVFSAFPKFIVNYQKEQKEAIRHEEENILKEQHMILSQTLAREETRVREKRARIHEARLLEAEKAANAALQVEEARLIEKRRQLAALRRELRKQEEESLAAVRVDLMEQQVKQRSAELDRLHHQLHSKAKQSGLDSEFLNEEVHEQFSRLIAKKQELQNRLDNQSLDQVARPVLENMIPTNELLHLRQQQQMLSEEIQKIRKENCNQGMKAVDIDVKLAEIDNLQQRMEVALARKAFLQQDLAMTAERCVQEAHAATALKKLEKEVEELTQKLSSIRHSDDPHAKCKTEETERKLLNLNDQNVCLEPSIAGEAFSLRSSNYYKKEKSAVVSAMELRKSLLSGWNTR